MVQWSLPLVDTGQCLGAGGWQLSCGRLIRITGTQVTTDTRHTPSQKIGTSTRYRRVQRERVKNITLDILTWFCWSLYVISLQAWQNLCASSLYSDNLDVPNSETEIIYTLIPWYSFVFVFLSFYPALSSLHSPGSDAGDQVLGAKH